MSAIDLVAGLKPLYAPPREPVLVQVPELSFLMVDGCGAPEGAAYQEALQALYGAAYTLKFALKKADPERDFRVAPLEGLWWVEDHAPGLAELQAQRERWQWTMLIAVPGHITGDDVAQAVAQAGRRRPLPALPKVRLERFAEGRAAQVLHVGPYADEAATIERLHAFIAVQGCTPRGRHHEIYLGDPRRTRPERLKTVIRQPVHCPESEE